MRFQGPIALAILCFLASTPAARGDESAAGPQADFSVLTPSMDGDYTTGNSDMFGYLPYIGGLAGLNTNATARRFRKLVAAESYDPAQTIAELVVDALNEQGFSSVHEPIPRRPAGSPQSLAWSDLPENPKGRLFLDLNIRSICFCTGDTYFKYRAAISVGWRLLDPMHVVVQPTRTLTYVHAPGAKPQQSTAPYPPAIVSESCAFQGLDDAEEDPQRLWECFSEAYRVLAQRLAIDLKRVHSPREAATASSDSPSGTSTR